MVKKLGVLLVICTLVLCGCSDSLTTQVTKQGITNYNNGVDIALNSYSKLKEIAIKNKDNVLLYLKSDINNNLTINQSDELSSDLREEFKVSSIVEDMYMTSLNSEDLTEIIILSSINKVMYATVVWGTDGSVTNISRVVKDL